MLQKIYNVCFHDVPQNVVNKKLKDLQGRRVSLFPFLTRVWGAYYGLVLDWLDCNCTFRLVNNAEDWVRVGLLSGFGGCWIKHAGNGGQQCEPSVGRLATVSFGGAFLPTVPPSLSIQSPSATTVNTQLKETQRGRTMMKSILQLKPKFVWHEK